ncbi:MAG: GNAT family N-acetyltransferase [Bacteroidia bacterium]|nr:GNAT family N-acetyltransferase [Bacteroidia bacterium]NNC84694.1 GNAT family N-acetyltransferase [Bacteroidia bacterium]NNM15999.1 GNAT family N-acetyltransferase [Bacteroidia bacterium]
MDLEQLFTDRLILREFSPTVADDVFLNYSEKDQMKFLGLQLKSELQKEQQNYKDGLSTFNRKFLYFHLIIKESKKLIGWCGYHTWYINHQRAELGYILTDSSEKGKGYMSEAIIPVIKFGFDKMKLNRIEAFTGLENTPSIKLLNKFNFTFEGQLREHYFTKNKLEDSKLYSLLKSEYNSQIK